ncbi:PIR protein [Plasmodium yoelii]|uniref:YIR protein n=1 Tax=Plasmodium yoelii TaxID=5861 RepID=A0A4V0KPZ4_PLAYE|nr:PIR protein [Plasmodium yoelii]VTZ80297.1 PIR protein [Plasmodium yoelii]|eukprot:XP_022812760.1 PIR protein [Plasmodium yoelii]
MAISNCQKFDNFRKLFQDDLKESREYKFNSGTFKKYCPNSNCGSDTDIVNAGCLWLFYEFFGKLGTTVDPNTYKGDVLCIMIWLSYILSLKPPDNITKLNDFYSNHIQNNEKYTTRNVNDEGYDSYKDIIDKIKEYMDININHMSKFYELLKLLCNMNTAYTKSKSTDFSQHANKFVYEYEKLLNDDNNIDNSSYDKILNVFSNYYNQFEKGRAPSKAQMERPQLPTEKTSKNVEGGSSKEIRTAEPSIEKGQSNTVTTILSSNTTLSISSLVNKLIPISFILVITIILLGIAYKYSLCGFRKRSQKQQIREKLKK